MSGPENTALRELQEEVNVYMLHTVATAKSVSESPFMSIQDYFSLTRVTHTERSQVVYLEVMDAVADNKDTIIQMLHDLHQEFICDRSMQWLVVEGDAKVYDILQALKFEYGDEMKWLIPYPGDWHMLKNFQPALMKAYYDAGLKSLAKAAGYPLAAIKGCGQFKRTHHFLLEAWEAVYRAMLTTFLEQATSSSQQTPPLQLITRLILTIPSQTESDHLKLFKERLTSINCDLQGSFTKFKCFIQQLAITDQTWKFWIQFVFQDAMAYVGLFLAIRSGDWHLRMASMKQMAPVFTAFDHPNYQKLISRHIADVLCMPTQVLTIFNQGAFVVSVSGRAWHSVGIDEAHEMLINRACKTSIVRPNPDYINRIARYIPFRSKTLENLRKQLFPDEKLQSDSSITPPFSKTRADFKREQNIVALTKLIHTKAVFTVPDCDRGLVNPFVDKVATPQQCHDLLNFRSIGQAEFLLRIRYFLLKEPSVQAPNRKRRLQTFSDRHVTRQKVTQLERDRKLILQCMRKKMRWSKLTEMPIENAGEQLLEIPLALADHQGNPNKGQKSYMTKALETRYKSCNLPIISTQLPSGWKPSCTIIEGMFLINTTPLGTHKTFKDYAYFLMLRYILTQFRKGCQEVHVLFDNPGQLENTPKHFEHMRRDSVATIVEGHQCIEFKPDTRLKGKWRESVINCRRCKRSLVKFLGQYMLDTISAHLLPNHKCLIAGAFDGHATNTAWFVQGRGTSQPDPLYACNAEETDTRIWLHVKQTSANRILVISPDTDVYHIGLPLQQNHGKDVIVQISLINARELRLLHMNNLISALQNDPDLAAINSAILPQVLQTLFVTSGCDYISFFHGVGKATFLRYFFQYASFISGNEENAKGTLADVSLDDSSYEQGFLSFLRLVGTIYYKKHATGFETPSPATHFSKFFDPSSTASQQHSTWLEDIRQTIWDRVTYETDMIPSMDALWRHWKRSVWVIHMWHQAESHVMKVKSILEYGWKANDDTLAIEWDSSDNIQAIQRRVKRLTKGCKCTTGCSNARCGCKKKNQQCSEGCSCTNCANLTISQPSDTELAEVALEESVTTCTENSDCDMDEVMDWVFGDDSWTISDANSLSSDEDTEDS